MSSEESLRKRVLRNVLWMNGGFAVRALIQVVYFVALARALGADEYGVFVGVLALTTLLAPFSTWGSGNILIKRVARDPACFRELWGAALATTLLSGALLILAGILVASAVFGWERGLLIALPVALGDILGVRLGDLAGQVFQAFQRLSRTALVWVGMALMRLLGVGLLYLGFDVRSAEVWAWLYGVTGLASGFLGVLWVGLAYGWGPLRLSPMRGEWREGFFFSVSLSSQGAYNDLDKALLARFSSEAAAGTYAAAYRVLDAAFIPIRAVLYAFYPRFFQEGQKGLEATRILALKLLPVAFLLALLGGGGMVGLAPFLPRILGEGFEGVPLVVTWLLPVLLFRAAHYFAADALTGAGFQGVRTAVQVGIVLLNLGLNLALIPVWGWRGAAVASWLSDGALALFLWGALFFLSVGKRALPIRR